MKFEDFDRQYPQVFRSAFPLVRKRPRRKPRSPDEERALDPASLRRPRASRGEG